MEGYLWIIWVKLAGALWIIGGKLGSSLIFYFVAIEENWRSTKNASRNLYSSGAQGAQRVITQNPKIQAFILHGRHLVNPIPNCPSSLMLSL